MSSIDHAFFQRYLYIVNASIFMKTRTVKIYPLYNAVIYFNDRKKSFSLSDSAVSPVTSIDTSSYYPSREPSREPSPRSSMSVAGREVHTRKLSLTPAHEKVKDFLVQGKRSPCMFYSYVHSKIYIPTVSHCFTTVP